MKTIIELLLEFLGMLALTLGILLVLACWGLIMMAIIGPVIP